MNYLTILQQATVVAWAIVAVASGFMVFSKKCSGVILCTSIAFVSLCAFSRVWVLAREEVAADLVMMFTGIALAIYFILRADSSWTSRSRR